jgi:hypothetical protein
MESRSLGRDTSTLPAVVRRMYTCNWLREIAGKAFNGPLHTLGLIHEPDEQKSFYNEGDAKAMVRQTGLSSQSFPYSSIFANRSSTKIRFLVVS